MNAPERMNPDDDYLIDRSTPIGTSGNFAENFDLQYYIRTLRKWKFPITALTTFAAIIAIYYAYTATPIYSATATLLIELQTPTFAAVEDLYGADTEDKDYYQTQFEILKSTTLAERVVEELDLWNHELLLPEPQLTLLQRAKRLKSSLHQSLLELRDSASNLAGNTPSETVEKSVESSQPDHQAKIGILESEIVEPLPAAGSLDSAEATADQTDDPKTLVITDTMLPGGSTMADVERATAQTEVGATEIAESEKVTPSEVVESASASNDAVLANFGRHLKIVPVRKTKLVKLNFESPDPKFAARVANAVGEQYITSYLDARLERTIRASEWLDERLVDLKLQLDESERRLIAFKEANELVDIAGNVGRLNEQTLVLLSTELAKAQSDLARATDLNRTVESLRSSPGSIESLPVMLSDPLLQRAKINEGNARRELDQLLNRYGELHPRVVDVRSHLQTQEQIKNGHIERIALSVEQEYQLARQRVTTIQQKLAEGKRGIQALSAKTFELESLEREVSTNRNIYERFFNRMTEASSIDGMDISNARISDRARVPTKPVKPRKQLIIVFSILAAAGLATFLAFIYETLDDTVKGARDVEQYLGVKFVGLLPIVKSKKFFPFKRSQRRPLSPRSINDASGVFQEAVKTVRTSICLEDNRKKNKVILITSSVPGEGKSTAAINLAASFAQLERVLLIDADLRRPSIALTVGISRQDAGLSNVIAKQATAFDCIHSPTAPGVADILASGPIPNQPLEVLSSPRLASLIGQLSEHYDRIIIDTAPVQAVSDSLVLSKLCDSVVYVVKSHSTSIDMIRRGLIRLSEVSAPLVGVVVTQVDVKKISKYGGDHFYQGYFDRYGYGKGQKRSPKIKFSNEELIDLRRDKTQIDLGFE